MKHATATISTTVLLCCASIVAARLACAAESSAADTLQTVVVTAQKREENLERVPLAVSALNGDELQGRGYQSLLDMIGVVPNLSVVYNTGVLYISIRGIVAQDALPGADPAVASHLNCIYLATHEDVGTSFYDVSRVEVLKGPQGTLFGRNAVGGAINIITNQPTDKFEVSAAVSAGNYNSLYTREILSGQVMDKVNARLAIATDNHSGYSLNLYDGRFYDNQNAASARLTVAVNPTDDLAFITYADYHRERDGNYPSHLGGIVNLAFPLQGVLAGGQAIPLGPDGLAINPQLLDDYSIPINRRKSWGIAEDFHWKLNEYLTLKSLTGYRDFNGLLGTNFQGTTWPFPSDYPNYNYIQFSTARQLSEELQLVASTPKLNGVFGLYYLDNWINNGGYSFGLTPAPMGIPLTAGGNVDKPAYAAFAQATYQFTDSFGATLGLRYSWEKSSVNTRWTSGGVLFSGFGPCVNLPNQLCHLVASEHFNSLTPRVEGHYQWTGGLMTYLSASKGFKSGGFEIAALTSPFKPATVWTYEFGTKFVDSNQRWSANFAVFHSDYKDMQVQEIASGITEIVNAAKSKIDGAEFELKGRPVTPLTIADSIGYVNGRYTDFTEQNPNYPFLGPPGIIDNSGHQLQYISKWTNNLHIEYDFPVNRGSLAVAGEWNWRSKIYFSEFNDPYEEQPAFSLLNAFVRYTSAEGNWYVQAYGKNLANDLVISQTSIGGCGCLNSQYMPPRTYGLTVGYKYRQR